MRFMDFNEQNLNVSQNRFDEVTEFPDHLAFAENLLNKYEWEPQTGKKFKAQLEALRKKHDDKFLNLSVIGEFSTGKSTFVNALLRRDNFLESSSLQGTTTTATVIENSDQYEIITVSSDGTMDEREFESCEALKERLADISADAEQASSLYSVTIRLPAPLLGKRGFRIIDTPGINSNELWHDDVTIRTIEELSDLSIIIIDATKPLPEQFCGFINSNLQSILDQCVFVVTKVNMIRKREIEGVMKYIKDKAEKEFSIAEPLILPYASTDVLDNMDKLENSIDLPELVTASLNSEKAMMEHMSSQKSIVQTLNLIALADNMYEMVQDHLDSIVERHTEALNIANRKRNIGLEFDSFLFDENNNFSKEFEDASNKIIGQITQFTQKLFRDCYNNVSYAINPIGTAEDLVKFTETELQSGLSLEMRSLLYKLNNTSDLVNDKYREMTSKFRAGFKEKFSDIDTLWRMSGEQFEKTVPITEFMCFPMLFPIIYYVNLATGNKSIFGTLIPKLNRPESLMRGKQNVRQVISDYLKDAYFKCIMDVESYIERTKECIIDANRRYVDSCKIAIKNELDDNSEVSIEEEISRLKADADRINVRKGKLDMVSRLLNIISRKEPT